MLCRTLQAVEEALDEKTAEIQPQWARVKAEDENQLEATEMMAEKMREIAKEGWEKIDELLLQPFSKEYSLSAGLQYAMDRMSHAGRILWKEKIHTILKALFPHHPKASSFTLIYNLDPLLKASVSFETAFPPPAACPSAKIAESSGKQQMLEIFRSTWDEFDFLLEQARDLPFREDTDPAAMKVELNFAKKCGEEMRRIFGETEKKMKGKLPTGWVPEEIKEPSMHDHFYFGAKMVHDAVEQGMKCVDVDQP